MCVCVHALVLFVCMHACACVHVCMCMKKTTHVKTYRHTLNDVHMYDPCLFMHEIQDENDARNKLGEA